MEPLSVRGNLEANGRMEIISIDICENLSARELASSMVGHTFCRYPSLDISRVSASWERIKSKPGVAFPIPTITASWIRLFCLISPSIGSGRTFSPFKSVTLSSSLDAYFHRFGIVGCGSKTSFEWNEPGGSFEFDVVNAG